ncbi:fluoride efflux transporter FluC [Alicyclobacillus vulcanalis]|uniref:fluoride efflux transporter FluC n=1 Tax=Alicyclobacillus vulcanalis TaxID=252246 RepID=UPI0009714AF0|nr:CrcB family protein [Alicyclobacillus vulcanalis]
MDELKRIGAVLVGGAIGGALRDLVDAAVGQIHLFPLGILLINLTGAFLLGMIQQLAVKHALPHWVVAGLGPGVMGGYTTFSTFAVGGWEALRLAPWQGVLYLVLTAVLGPLCAWLGTKAVPVRATPDDEWEAEEEVSL